MPCFSTLYRVDAIEGRELALVADVELVRFSTLYRVDAIEGQDKVNEKIAAVAFQYPLSGRCY